MGIGDGGGDGRVGENFGGSQRQARWQGWPEIRLCASPQKLQACHSADLCLAVGAQLCHPADLCLAVGAQLCHPADLCLAPNRTDRSFSNCAGRSSATMQP
eukprot:205235-Pelagomonas_calceolata.AAC.7